MCVHFSSNKLFHIKPLNFGLFGKSKKVQPKILNELPADMFEKSVLIPDYFRINHPAETKEEYLELLNQLKQCKTNGEFQYAYFTEMNNCLYEEVDKELEGLLPYCGVDDSSKLINMYLSGRLTQKWCDEHFCALPKDMTTLPDVVRVLEYSLKRLDEKYGRYSGIVYRYGFMGENPSQYISTTSDSSRVSKIKNPAGDFRPDRKYSVIKVNNGHKIYEFQQRASDVGRLFAKKEREVLLPFGNKYRKLANDELTEDLLGAKMLMASYFFKDAVKLFTGEQKVINDYTAVDLLNTIDVYVQL